MINSILLLKNSQHTFAKSVRYIQHFSSRHICSCQFITVYIYTQIHNCPFAMYNRVFINCHFASVNSRLTMYKESMCLQLSIHVSVCSRLHTTVISQVSMCRRDHGRRTSPDDGRMPENLCRLPTRNAYHHKMIGKF